MLPRLRSLHKRGARGCHSDKNNSCRDYEFHRGILKCETRCSFGGTIQTTAAMTRIRGIIHQLGIGLPSPCTTEAFWRIPHSRAIAQRRPDVADRHLEDHMLRLCLLPFHHVPTAEQIFTIRTDTGSYRLDFQQRPVPHSRLGIVSYTRRALEQNCLGNNGERDGGQETGFGGLTVYEIHCPSPLFSRLAVTFRATWSHLAAWAWGKRCS